ncbi:class I SAM-dependent methyltransferase [Kitasatospora sp. NPDC049258]|uniref:class I SAM-dependent methyltransferase n=1 Tax=Kitasatospora sp. NPDC049258 TaxID=3155394 RepID=UPI00341C7DD5
MAVTADDEEFAAFERRGWARRSATYHDGFGAMTAGLHEALLDAAAVGAGIRLLEVGCGTGRLAARALARGARVVATDADRRMAGAAAAALPGALVRTARLPGLPFAGAEFDAAIGAFVINHVPDPPAAVADLGRVLRPGGRLVLSCWDTAERNRAQGVFFDAVAEAGAARPPGVPAGSPFARYAGPEALAGLLRAAGLAEVRVERAGWTHRVDADRWWQDVLDGTVLTAALIEGRPPQEVERIRAAYGRLAARYRDGFPAAALVAVGTRV